VRVERAQSDTRRLDAEPTGEIFARDHRRGDYSLFRQLCRHIAQRDVCRRQHNAERIPAIGGRSCGGKHHRDTRTRQRGEHLGMSGVAVSASEKRRLVYWRGDNSADFSRHRQLDRSLDCLPAELSGECGSAATRPFADGDVHVRTAAAGSDHH